MSERERARESDREEKKSTRDKIYSYGIYTERNEMETQKKITLNTEKKNSTLPTHLLVIECQPTNQSSLNNDSAVWLFVRRRFKKLLFVCFFVVVIIIRVSFVQYLQFCILYVSDIYYYHRADRAKSIKRAAELRVREI